MRFSKIAIAVSITLMLASCASQPTVPGIEFNYKVENANAAGVVQVFDMTGNTVVQIRDIENKNPIFLDEKQQSIKYQVVGQTAILTGLHPVFTVLSGHTSSKVTRVNGMLAVSTSKTTGAPADRLPPSQPTLATAAEPTDAELLAQLKSMKAELADLKMMLAASSDNEAPPKSTDKMPKYAVVSSSKSVSSLRVQFKDNSSEFDPKPATAATLIDLAKEANEISITGYTDSTKSTAASLRLAKERATAASQYLVSRGVEKTKIQTRYQAAGGFIAENRSKEGRDQNRRVEISML